MNARDSSDVGRHPLAEAGRALTGVLLGLVARLWLSTLRVRLEVDPALANVGDRPWVLSFFHGTQWPLLAWRRRRPTVVLVSLSKDGAIQARALAKLGFSVVRGSSSRGGARGLAALVRRLRGGGSDAAFAVDGPRGPYGEVKPGALLAARRAGGVLVPMGSAATRAKVFERAWDRFTLALPFSTVAVVLGAPMSADEGARGGDSDDGHGPALENIVGANGSTATGVLAATPERNLELAIRKANDRARALLAS